MLPSFEHNTNTTSLWHYGRSFGCWYDVGVVIEDLPPLSHTPNTNRNGWKLQLNCGKLQKKRTNETKTIELSYYYNKTN